MVMIKEIGSTMKRALVRLAAVAGTVIAAVTFATPAAASTITYYHNDLAGSPVVATNSSAQVIWRESYRPYGERLTKSAASKPNDVWFTSRRQDSTGLVYMGARYYDPVTGRFVSTDPKGFDEANVLSSGRYTYANDNPLKYVDPDGKTGVLATTAAGAEIGTLVCAAPCTAAGALVGLGVGMWGTWKLASVLHNEASEDPPKGDIKIDDKIRGQLGARGWSEQDVREAARGEPAGTTTDDRRPSKTDDSKGRKGEPASVYGSKDGYIVVNDRSRELVQVSDRNPDSGWIPDSRIKWSDK